MSIILCLRLESLRYVDFQTEIKQFKYYDLCIFLCILFFITLETEGAGCYRAQWFSQNSNQQSTCPENAKTQTRGQSKPSVPPSASGQLLTALHSFLSSAWLRKGDEGIKVVNRVVNIVYSLRLFLMGSL